MVIVWSHPARQDLHLIHQYIAHDSQRYAKRVIQDITNKVDILLSLPQLGKVVPETDDNKLREISMYSYRIIYEQTNDAIYIHGVFHKRRNISPKDIIR